MAPRSGFSRVFEKNQDNNVTSTLKYSWRKCMFFCGLCLPAIIHFWLGKPEFPNSLHSTETRICTVTTGTSCLCTVGSATDWTLRFSALALFVVTEGPTTGCWPPWPWRALLAASSPSYRQEASQVGQCSVADPDSFFTDPGPGSWILILIQWQKRKSYVRP